MRDIRISLLAAALACAISGQDFVSLAQHAVELQQGGHYKEAAQAYRELLKLDPNQVTTHVNLAIVLVNLGQYDEAIAEYKTADKLLPGEPRISLNLALAYEKSGRIQEARDGFEALHVSDPANARITGLLADCELQLGDDARVVELLKPLADQNTSDLAVAYMLGMALLQEHHADESQMYLDRILKNGDTAEARFLLGTRMFEAGDYPAAVKQFAGAVELNPNLPQLQSFYGRALLNTGDPDAAAAAFRKELVRNPNDYAANSSLAQILIVRKNAQEALPFAERALAARPKSAEANLVVAQSLLGSGRFGEARRYAELAASGLAGSSEAHRTLFYVYAGLHRDTEAKRELQLAQILEREAEDADSGPRLNGIAPDFQLPRVGSSERVALHDFRGKSPVVLIFGSYSCPNFRDAAESLKSMQHRYGARVPFLLVYIREAHSTAEWASTRNVRQDVTIAPAVTLDERTEHAAMCERKLHLAFPAIVDGMDNAVETAYNAWPSRAFIIGADGRLLYSTRLTELDFHASEMEAVLERLSR